MGKRFSVNASAVIAVAMGSIAVSSMASAKPVTAVLRLKERVPMEALAREVLNPASDRYGKFYSPSEIRALSAPSIEEYKAVINQLRLSGFTISKESKTHLWISVTADHTLFEKTFATRLQMNGKNRMQLIPTSAPLGLEAVASVIGLDNSRKARPKFIRQSAPASAPGGLQPSDVKAAYAFNPIYSAGLSGAGQDVAVATYDGFMIDDVKYYYDYQKLSPVPSVDQVQFNGVPTYNEGSAGETQLDAEFIGMIAPGAKVHVFASATNDDTGEAQLFTAILDDNRAKVVNYSWGSCESQLVAAHRDEMAKIFARAVAQGVNIMVASGDTGSDGCRDGSKNADWPGANDYIVAVGGTSLDLGKGVATETAWNGSGGGISDLFSLPAWQASLGAPYIKRSFPDVSFNADPVTGQAIYMHNNGSPVWMVIGGTSMAAPQWSGLMALVGEARAKNKKQPLGYLNPVIYSIPNASRAPLFNDITVGSNGAYSAGPGWDAVTGLGTPKADALLGYLSAF